MNYEILMKDLEEWKADEIFFRDFYRLRQEGKPVEAFLRESDADPADIAFALKPQDMDSQLKETRFFESGRNVRLLKHPRFSPFFTHSHFFFEMIYVLKGQCTETTEDRTVELQEGDICLLAPYVEHGIKVYDDSLIMNVLIRYSTFLDIFMNTIRDKSTLALFFIGNLYGKNKINYLLFHTFQDEAIRNYILDMFLEQINPDEYSDRVICSILTIFFVKLVRIYGKTVEMPNMRSFRSEYGNDMINYMVTEYRTITLNELAEHFHFSVPYCSKLVKEITGNSFMDFITQVRMQKAENLLMHTQMSIADIGEQVGYKNTETFIRSFKRIYRMSPSWYRKINSAET